MKKLSLTILLFCFSGLFSQNQKLIDSLENLVQVSKKDTNVVSFLIQLNNNYRNFNPDSAFSKCNYALKLSENLKYNRGIAKSYLSLSILYRRKGEHTVALDYQLKALKFFELINDKASIAKVYGNMGITYWNQGNFPQSLKFYQKALTIDSVLNNKQGISSGYNNIGGIYEQQKDFKKSLEYYLQAVKIEEELGDEEGLSDTYGNIGSNYFNIGNNDEAIKYQLKSIALCEKIGNKNSLSSGYLNMGASYAKKKNYKEALKNIQIGLTIAKEIDYKEAIKNCYKSFSDVYTELGDDKLALDYFRKYSDIHDSLTNEANSKQIAEMETIYQSEKKDKENKLLQKENELSLKTIKQQKITSYFIITGLILSLTLVFFIFRNNLQRKKNNIALQQKNNLIEKQKEEVHHQKEIVEEKQKEILDSIHYAKRIQRAVITSDNYIAQYVKDYFIYYQPKDIVSGDFYWAVHTNNKFYLATADCTGHGVPGAFMSLLNISIFNEVMIEKKITRADLILNEARKDIIKSLNPTGSEESKDGMDCILACFDFENLKLEYAAANNSFYIIRNNELIICKADKMPVGKSPRDEEPFTLHTVDLQKGDTVYMLTDGLPDQFGGPKGKKYKYKQLEDLLIANNENPLNEQQEILSNSLNEWKGNLEQVDDILLIGIKI